MNKQVLLTTIVTFGLLSALSMAPTVSYAQELSQDSGQSSTDDIEALFSKDEPEQQLDTSESSTQQQSEIKEISDLDKLVPFSDVAVIQKRYLPKTGRFEAFGGGSVILNDVFFLSFGFAGRLAYHFSEKYGVEFVGLLLNTTERQVTTDLRNQRGVLAQSFITPKQYLGLDFRWTPIYGKMTWLNSRITPFDLYFSLGGGTTSTNQGTSEPTLHIGTGQMFALSKSMAARWDFSWNFFNATSKVANAESSSMYNNLIITVGMSFFFPEAGYR